MRHLTLANLRANPVRFVATLLAVLVGTGFLSTTLVLRDSLGASIEAGIANGLSGIDAAVVPYEGDVASFGGKATIPPQVEGIVASADGVAAAASVRTADLNLFTTDGSVIAEGAGGIGWIDDPGLASFSVVDGEVPRAEGEIAVDQRTFDRKDLALGQAVSVGTANGPADGIVVGIVAYGNEAQRSTEGDVVVAEVDAEAWLATGDGGVDAVIARSDTLDEVALAASVDEALSTVSSVDPAGVEVLTGDEYRDRVGGQAASLAQVIGTGLQVFAYVALFVSIFIIYNTFTVVVAQRVRELALLRAIGATGKQVRRAVRLEALVVGFVASVAGVVVGIVAFELLIRFVPALADLGGGGSVVLSVRPMAVLQVVLTGVIITWLSAAVPSWRASRIRPIAALRDSSVDRSGASKIRAGIGLVLVALGATTLAIGASGASPWFLAPGPLLLFLGTLVAGPVLAAGFAALASRIVGTRNPVRHLATANAGRNPNRTATTANALVIGLFLVVFVTAAGGSLRDWAVRQVAQLGGSDLSVQTVDLRPLPDGLSEQILAIDGVDGGAEVVLGVGVSAAAGDAGQSVSGGDVVALQGVQGFDLVDGSLEGLGPRDVVVRDFGGLVKVGDDYPVTLADGSSVDFNVSATTSFTIDSAGSIVTPAAAAELAPTSGVNYLVLSVDGGQYDAVVAQIDGLLADYSTVTVFEGGSITQLIKGFFNAVIASVNGLLAIAVVIALFGIVNTLVLSITERTREIGLLRAVGMTRSQLAASIRTEAVLTAALGTVIGTVMGLFVAWAVTRQLLADGGGFSWPLRELVVVMALGIVIGLVAAVIPAWRASRLDVLEALQSE